VYRVSAARLAVGCALPHELDIVLTTLLDEALALDGSLILVQDIDLCVSRSPLSSALIADACDRGLRMLATARSAGFIARLFSDDALRRRLVAVPLEPASRMEAVEAAERFAQSSLLDISPAAVQAAVYRAETADGAAPGGAISLLGAAMADAEWDSREHIGPDDVFAVLESQWPEFQEKE
jgi:hypothetical protein